MKNNFVGRVFPAPFTFPKRGMRKIKRVYLDNSSTTKPSPEVMCKMIEVNQDCWGNPSSLHDIGRKAKKELDIAREHVADFLNADVSEIIFTSSGTESNSLAILGTINTYARLKNKNHCITTEIEHPSVYNMFKKLENEGFYVTYLPVDERGLINIDDFKAAISKDTLFASIQHTNNEVGTIQDIAMISTICDEHDIFLHTDAVQGIYSDLDVEKLGVDLLTISSHKLHGPKGSSALYVRNGIKLYPVMMGGGQEQGLRSGTENVPSIAGFGKACFTLSLARSNAFLRLNELKLKFISGIKKAIPDISINGHLFQSSPHIISVVVKGINSESLLLLLDMYGISCSAGSACNSHSITPSRTLKAMDLSDDDAFSTLRFSLSRFNTEEDIDYVIERFSSCVKSMRDTHLRGGEDN